MWHESTFLIFQNCFSPLKTSCNHLEHRAGLQALKQTDDWQLKPKCKHDINQPAARLKPWPRVSHLSRLGLHLWRKQMKSHQAAWSGWSLHQGPAVRYLLWHGIDLDCYMCVARYLPVIVELLRRWVVCGVRICKMSGREVIDCYHYSEIFIGVWNVFVVLRGDYYRRHHLGLCWNLPLPCKLSREAGSVPSRCHCKIQQWLEVHWSMFAQFPRKSW